MIKSREAHGTLCPSRGEQRSRSQTPFPSSSQIRFRWKVTRLANDIDSRRVHLSNRSIKRARNRCRERLEQAEWMTRHCRFGQPYVPLPNSAPKPPVRTTRRGCNCRIPFTNISVGSAGRQTRSGGVQRLHVWHRLLGAQRARRHLGRRRHVRRRGARQLWVRCVLACEYRCGFIQSIRVECERES